MNSADSIFLQGVSLENNILLYILIGMLHFLSSADICAYGDDWGYSFGLNSDYSV